MADIQFEEPVYAKSPESVKKPSQLSGLLIKTGLAKDDAGAQKVLLMVLVVVVILIIWINWPSSPDLGPAINSPDGTFPAP